MQSKPDQAAVFLDGRDTGQKTPAQLHEVPAGKRVVELFRPGWDPVRIEVNVRASEQKVVSVDLHRKGTSPGVPGEASVYGFVLEDLAGEPVEGATVRAYKAGTREHPVGEDTTDGEGAYGFNLPPGEYDIVASKSGHVEAKRQSVRVNAGDLAQADLILKDLLDPTRALKAPTFSVMYAREDGVFEPFEPGTIVVGPTRVRIKVNAVNPVWLLRVRVGGKALDPQFNVSEYEFVVGDDEVPGETELIVDAYDLALNWTEVRIPFVIAGVPSARPFRVTGVDVTAVTYGADLQRYRLERAEAFRELGVEGNPDLLSFKDGSVLNLASLRQDAALQVQILWDPVPGAQGYDIERAESPAGPWRLIAQGVPATYGRFGNQERPYIDTSADLYPGITVYYRVRAVGAGGERGEWSTPVGVTPLKRFEVRQLDPPHGANNVPLKPVFRWTYNDVGAQDYGFEGYVIGMNLDSTLLDSVWEFADMNISEVEFNYNGLAKELLRPAKMYRWRIFWAFATTIYGVNSRAVSLAGWGAGSTDGEFVFTTAYYE